MRRLHERALTAPGASLLPAAGESRSDRWSRIIACDGHHFRAARLSQQGVTGGFFKALALTMASALIVSLFVALFVVPLLTDWLVRARDAERAERQDGILYRVRIAYERLALRIQRRRGVAAITAGLLVAFGVLAFFRLPSGFMPHMDEGGFVLDYRAAPGTSLAETDRLVRQVES